MESDYISGAFTLAGAVVGGGAAILATVVTERMKLVAAKRSVAGQLHAEISALMEIEERRGYRRGLRDLCDSLVLAGPGATHAFAVHFQDAPFKVYYSTMPSLGLLPLPIQRDVVKFYQWLESIMQDLKPGGTSTSDGGEGVDVYLEALSMMEDAVTLAQGLLPRLQAEQRTMFERIAKPERFD